ncbi:hypothetical protein BH09DEP1_BH09DEP1_1670 [soil metagenome]
MKNVFICFVLVFAIFRSTACERIKKLICAIHKCTLTVDTIDKLVVHRFTHTEQRPFHCSACGHQGYRQLVARHIRRYCPQASMEKTTLVPATITILNMPAAQKKADSARYYCAINGCSSQSRLLSKIAKHRYKKHISQKRYACSLCKGQYDEKEGKSHRESCSKLHKCNGQLLRNKLFPGAKALLAAPVIRYYPDGWTAILDDMIRDDAFSIEYLPDSEEEMPQVAPIAIFEEF